MESNIENLSRIYGLSEEKFEEYKKSALMVTTTGKRPSTDKTLIIVGGQAGAGKTRVIPVAKQELKNNAVVVDFDELRSLHPNYEIVSRNYSDITHRILHPDTNRVKKEILTELIRKGYNVIYEGALRDTEGFLDFARDFRKNDYNIKMYIMAVPKLESYGSTFLRYAMAYVTGVTPRWVEQPAHDGSYEGVPRTVSKFIEEKMVDDIHVLVRGKGAPREIYSTQGRQFETPLVAIEYGRDMGRKKAIEDFQAKYKTVSTILEEKEPEKVKELEKWLQLYHSELKYFKDVQSDLKNRE